MWGENIHKTADCNYPGQQPEKAGEIIHDFFRYEFDQPIECHRLTVQLLREPEDGIGVVYEPEGGDTRWMVANGRLIPVVDTTGK